ncbi:hypothetical protein ACVWXP_004406 [Bradyrhizobium sp. USDA 4463]
MRSDVAETLSLKIGEPCVFSTPATSVRSLIGTGRPASNPRAPAGFRISALALSRARSKHSVGSALTLPSTSVTRFSTTSNSSSGETSPERKMSTTVQAVSRIRS